ncbi:hypothetical protein [Labrenzia sp. PHM005]|uniref:hypothetical protein n=1 Tax=Labrenzia sp. PHM005 TaxID=2590016 RepID=UPI0011406A37|nr:hypothetical protein [Labrenzia sp. PHM005]QDG78850.1 hypothetical protein FJ695_24930 [Labrenzia sp. PHM005]
MSGLSGRKAVSVSLLGVVCAFAISREFGLNTGLAPVAGTALLLWAGLEWRGMALIAKVTFGAGLALGAAIALTGGMTAEILELAVGRSAFFTFFLMSMDILRTAAMSSKMVLDSGRMIVTQPPGRRYAMITIGGHLFAILLNLGAITLLGTMNRRSIEASRGQEEDSILDIRLKRMTLALVRGFTAFTMWSPTAVTMIVLLSAIPGFDWYQFAPIGFASIVFYLSFGWLFDRLSYPRRQTSSTPQPLVKVLKTFVPMSSLTVVILSSAVLFSWLSGIRLVAALFICVPMFGIGWITVQYSRAGPKTALALTNRRLLQKILPDLTTMRSEVAILSAAGFIAALLPYQINTQELGQFIAGLGLTEGWLLVALMWFVALTAPLGLNPIISVAVSVEVLSRLSGFHFNPYLLILSGTVAWGLATGSSPLGATIRIAGRTINRSPGEIGLVWNRPFCVAILLISSALQLLLN